MSTSSEGGEPTRAALRDRAAGVRLVLSDCVDPVEDAAFRSWYVDFAVDCTVPGLLDDAVLYELDGIDADADHARYLALYDIGGDVATAWPNTQHHPARRYSRSSPLFALALKATYARVGPRSPAASTRPAGGVVIFLGDPASAAAHEEIERWYARHSAAVLAGGECVSARRFTLVDGSPSPPAHLEIYETESDAPARLLHELRSSRPRVELLRPRSACAYRQIFAHPSN